MSRTFGRFAFLSALLAMSATAHAEPNDASSCEEGMVATEAMDGHCCWPGQTWSEERERCAGTPRCPQGWAMQGSMCVRGGIVEREARVPASNAPTPPAAPVIREEAPLVAPSAPEKTASPPDAPPGTSVKESRQAQLERLPRPSEPVKPDPDEEFDYDGGPIPAGATLHWKARRLFASPGFVLAGVGHGLSVLVFTMMPCRSTNALAVVPVIGAGIAGIASHSSCDPDGRSSSLSFGLIDSGVQAVGLALIIASFVKPQRYLLYDAPPAEKQSWSIVPGTRATPNGLTLVANF